MRRRRSYPWEQIAARARSAPGVWRLHPALITVTPHLERHARRRVRALRSTEAGTYRFARHNQTVDHLGRTVFDLLVKYTINEGATHGDH